MRQYPLMPCDPSDETNTASYSDMHSCVKLPSLWCALKGCRWAIHKTSGDLLEWELYHHLLDKHATSEMQDVFDWARRRIEAWRTTENDRSRFLWVHSF